jgi:hypothetical protein
VKRLKDFSQQSKVKRRDNEFGSVGAGIIHDKGVPFMNIYMNSVLNQRRTTSKGAMRKKKVKKNPMRSSSGLNLDSSTSREAFINEEGLTNIQITKSHPEKDNEAIDQIDKPLEFKDSKISKVNSLSLNSVLHAKKLREAKEMEVKRLHMRIASLMEEEERAFKRIQQTKQKAQQILDFKIEQNQLNRERFENQETQLQRARENA